MEFITDSMLGKITRWLRMLGYNIKYFRSIDDKQLIKYAKTEHRTLLTRDRELYQQAIKQEITAFLVEGATEAEKLANLAKQFDLKLEFDVKVSRCPKCNTRIKTIPKDRIVSRVHKRTLSSYSEFWECPGCEQIYWRGAHWKRINETLKRVKQIIG